MSWFIKCLKYILCVEDEEREVSGNGRQYNEYQRLSSDNPYSNTTLTHSPLRNQSNIAKTTSSSKISSTLFENSAISPSIQKRESSVLSRNVFLKSSTTAMDGCNKIPIVSPQFTTKANVASSSSDVLRTIKGNQVTSDVTKHVSPYKVVSDSSHKSLSSCDLPAHVHSSKPPSVTAKPTPASEAPQKSSQCACKTKDLPLSFSGSNVHKSNTSNSSASTGLSKPSQSSPKPLFPGSPEHFSSESPKPPPISTKPTLSPLSNSTSQQKKNNYVWVEKSGSTTYIFPEDIKCLIQKDILPGVLKSPLSSSTYKDYFHALLYAEDCHLEKWEGFEVKNVILELHDATIYTGKRKSRSYNEAVDEDKKMFVTFDIDKVLEKQSPFDRKQERRPFLLSRDFISVKPTGRKMKPFKGVIYRVVKSSLILAEFGEDFHTQHVPGCEYNVNFSFNRVCLKRAHHAITAAPDTLYRNFLFPNIVPKQELPSTVLFANYRYKNEAFAVWQISRLQNSPPYLVEGSLSIVNWKHLSRTAFVIIGAVLQICRKSPSNRVLLCAPLNNTCDELMIALKKYMDESDMFRANAAFREIDGVPEDILPSCLYKKESDCFACPSLEELKKYKVISSTFMSSFRLRDEGMVAGHFSHIFLVDASSVTEPEAIVPLANFANSETVVVITGAPRNRSGWVRSKIARQNGLMISYFERLRESAMYQNLDSRVITRLEDRPGNLNERHEPLSPFLNHISLF